MPQQQIDLDKITPPKCHFSHKNRSMFSFNSNKNNNTLKNKADFKTKEYVLVSSKETFICPFPKCQKKFDNKNEFQKHYFSHIRQRSMDFLSEVERNKHDFNNKKAFCNNAAYPNRNKSIPKNLCV